MQSVATLPAVKPEELRRIREELGLTQEELAQEIGVHRVTIAKWEAGDRGISELCLRLQRGVGVQGQRRSMGFMLR